jgi:hypothetical protein
VDIAEEKGRTWAIESDRTLRAGLVENKVEAFAAVERKHVMEPGVEVWEIDDAADGNNEQAGFEMFVALDKAIVAFVNGVTFLERLQWSQPNNDTRGVGCMPRLAL